ncbi:MAG: OpgC domain-containing protein [Verrucomicrobia bacterium]|nr:OpgC domain-containing protein [Verrucomicrobiota bacterium]
MEYATEGVMKRLVELDILRGFLLLLMISNHSPSPLRRFTDQPVGFFSTAEDFVFVSAFLAGMLFQKRTERQGFEAAKSATMARALRIYQAHLVTLVFTFAVGSLFLLQLPGLQDLLSHYWTNPAAAALASLGLAFQPPLMDILPMYIVFSLLTPVAFWAAKRFGWRSVFIASAALWVLSQFHLRDLLLGPIKSGFPFIDPGPFDLLSWQFLWVGGLLFGKCLQARQPVKLPVVSEVVFLLLAIGFLIWRWYCNYVEVDPSATWWFLNKWHLGPLRVLNFFVVTWLGAKVLPQVARWQEQLKPLAWVGQNMLPVFAFQICLTLVLVGWLTPANNPGGLASTALVVLQTLLALLFAWLLDWRRTRQKLADARPTLGMAHSH